MFFMATPPPASYPACCYLLGAIQRLSKCSMSGNVPNSKIRKCRLGFRETPTHSVLKGKCNRQL